MKLLTRWQSDVEHLDAFEAEASRADSLLSLAHWARHVAGPVPALASHAAEDTLFRGEVERVAKVEEFETLAQALEAREPFYAAHRRGFLSTAIGCAG